MKNKMSPQIIIISGIINISFIVSAILFAIYGCTQPYVAIFITLFMFAYHADIRLLIGFIVSIFKKRINVDKKCFAVSLKEYKRLDKLKIKKWKEHVLTLYKNQFTIQGSFNKERVEAILKNNINAEITHWICFFISLLAILFGYLLSPEEIWIYICTSIACSLLLDLPFILIQRYNRYKLLKIKSRM